LADTTSGPYLVIADFFTQELAPSDNEKPPGTVAPTTPASHTHTSGWICWVF